MDARRTIVGALACLLVVSLALVAPAGAGRKTRSVVVEYVPSQVSHEPSDPEGQVSLVRTSDVQPLRSEGRILVSVTDDSGLPVLAILEQGDIPLSEPFCGEMKRPARLITRKGVHVHLLGGHTYGTSGCSQISAPSVGQVEFRFGR